MENTEAVFHKAARVSLKAARFWEKFSLVSLIQGPDLSLQMTPGFR